MSLHVYDCVCTKAIRVIFSLIPPILYAILIPLYYALIKFVNRPASIFLPTYLLVDLFKLFIFTLFIILLLLLLHFHILKECAAASISIHEIIVVPFLDGHALVLF